MNTHTLILNKIFDFFVESNDFNGIPLTNLSKKLNRTYLDIVDQVSLLVIEKLVTVQYGVNPHIISIDYLSLEQQMLFLDKAKENKTKTLSSFQGFKGKINFVS